MYVELNLILNFFQSTKVFNQFKVYSDKKVICIYLYYRFGFYYLAQFKNWNLQKRYISFHKRYAFIE